MQKQVEVDCLRVYALCEVRFGEISQPPYSDDRTPSDYYLFSDLKNYLRGRTFSNLKSLKTCFTNCHKSKTRSFFSDGIEALTARWDKYIKLGGEYIETE